MKLSAFLAVSVPIVAISQAPVSAQDGTTGAWLQDSIASLTPQKAVAAKWTGPKTPPAVKKVTHAAPTAGTLRLRPFQPGRYLPSEKELRYAVQAQQARYDYSQAQAQQPRYDYAAPNAMLNGQVATNYAARPATVYDQYAMTNGYASAPMAPAYSAPKVKPHKREIGKRAPRVIPQQMPVLPEQLTHGPGLQQGIQPLIPEPPMQRQVRAPFPVSMPVVPMQQPVQYQQPAAQYMPPQQMSQPAQMPFQAAMPQFQPAEFSESELAALHRHVALNPPTARMTFNGEVVGQAMDNPGNGIGQPPFPLNLLGGNAMQTLSRSQNKANVTPARFGSWHSNVGLASGAVQSYVARRQPIQFDYYKANSVSKRKVNKRSRLATPQVVPLRQKSVVVATYPAYASARGAY